MVERDPDLGRSYIVASREATISGGLKLMARPNVAKMFVAYLVTYTGTAMAPIAMAFGVLDLTGSTADASIVIAAPTLASIVVLLIGGAVADRTSRHKVIYIADSLSMVAQLCLAWLFLSGHATIPLLTLFMLLNGISIAFHMPALMGFIVQLVSPDELQYTNAILGTARNGAIAGGAALGGILVATVGAGYTLLIDALTFGVSAILIFTVKPAPQTATPTASMLADLKLGWHEFTSHTWLWVIVLQFSLIVAATEAVFGLIGPAIAKNTMRGAQDWGYIASGFGVGTLVGGLVAMRLRPRFPMRLATLLVFTFSAVSIALYLSAPLYLIVCSAIFSGLAGQIFAVLWHTTLQLKVPTQMLSRVSAYDHLGSVVLAPLGIVIGGICYELYGAQTTLTVAIATVIVPTICTLCVRDVRMMTNESDQ
ncbi:MAG: MFS transporter [Pseudomonadales bacterium]|nr:MFS transporter [Pseudomonadales bacterium]